MVYSLTCFFLPFRKPAEGHTALTVVSTPTRVTPHTSRSSLLSAVMRLRRPPTHPHLLLSALTDDRSPGRLLRRVVKMDWRCELLGHLDPYALPYVMYETATFLCNSPHVHTLCGTQTWLKWWNVMCVRDIYASGLVHVRRLTSRGSLFLFVKFALKPLGSRIQLLVHRFAGERTRILILLPGSSQRSCYFSFFVPHGSRRALVLQARSN